MSSPQTLGSRGARPGGLSSARSTRLRRAREEPRMPFGVVRPIISAVLGVLGRMDDFRASRLGDFVVLVDVVEVDKDPHRGRANVIRRPYAAIMSALPHHHQLPMKRGLAVHSATWRSVPHLLLEAKGASQEFERGRHVAIEE